MSEAKVNRRNVLPSSSARPEATVLRAIARSPFSVVVSAALVAASSMFGISPVAAFPTGPPSAGSGSRIVTLTCAGVGELAIVLRADAAPAPAPPLPIGVSLRTAYRAKDSRTKGTFSGGEHGDIYCGQVPVHAVVFGGLSQAAAPAGVVATDLFDGSVAISLASTDISVSTNRRLLTAVATPGAGIPFPFAAALRTYLTARSGRHSVAVFDATTGVTYSYNAGAKYVTASIVKVAILGTLLRRAQDARRSLTATERSLAARMIERSDNAATTSLWNRVGRGVGVKAFLSRVGMSSTTPGTGGLWGLTSTNAPDQVRLVRTIAYPNTVLSAVSRRYAESLMRAVIPSQKWGVSSGVPAGATVAFKNGWLPRTGGWVINSIGHVRGSTRDYVIAVLTSGNPTMSYGIATVQHVSGTMRVLK